MSFFGDDRPLGPWDHQFNFPEELGCLATLAGFLVFLVIVALLQQFLFK